MTHRVIELYDRHILGRPGRAVLILLAVFAFFAYWSKDFRLDASGESLVLEHDPDLRYYNQVSRRYASKDFVVVTYQPSEELFSEPSLERLKRLREELKGLQRAASVVTILDVPLLKNPPVPLKEVRSNLKTLESKETDKDLAVAEFRDSPLYHDLLVSSDLRSCVIQVNFAHDSGHDDLYARRADLLDKKRDGTLTPQEKLELKKASSEFQRHKDLRRAERHQDIAAIRTVIEKYRKECRIYLGGVPMIVDDIIQFIKNDLLVFGLGMMCFLVFSLGIIFRMWRWILLPLLSCFFVVIVLVGLLGMIGWEVTVVSSNFISLTLVFALELSIYLIVRYRELRVQHPDRDHRFLVRETVGTMFTPCAYAAATTIAGFDSLIFCDILPVINFGYMMTLALAVNLVVIFLFFPAALMLFEKAPAIVEKEFGRPMTSFFARLAESRIQAILLACAAIGLFTALGVTQLQAENSFINYFKKTTEIYKGMKFIDQELGGTTPLELIISFNPQEAPEAQAAQASTGSADEFDEFGEFEKEDADSSKYWFTVSKLEQVNKAHDYLESLPAAGKVQSLATLWKLGREINDDQPLDNLMLQILFDRMPDDFKDAMVRPYSSVENNEARIVMRVKDSIPGLRRDAMIRQIKKDLVEKVGLKESQFRLTGLMVLYNNMLQSLYSSQIKTIGWTFVMLTLMFLLEFRSIKIALIAIFPNALSCLSVLGIMGLGNIPLDVMTITIVAIGMGVADDSTIQYLYKFGEEFQQDRSYAQTMRRCHGSIGNSVYYTCGTFIAGYSILAFSNFIPTILFGLLSAFAMFMSLLGALCLLPVLIVLVKPFGPEQGLKEAA